MFIRRPFKFRNGFRDSRIQKMCIQLVGWLSIFVLAIFITASFSYLYDFPTLLRYLLFCPFHHPSFLHHSVCERRSTLPHLCQKTTATLLLWEILFPYILIWRIAYDNDFKTDQLALLSVLAYVDVCYSSWPRYQTRLLSFLAVKAPANESTETLPLHWSERGCITICRHPDVLRRWKWRLWVKAWTFALPLTVQGTDTQDFLRTFRFTCFTTGHTTCDAL